MASDSLAAERDVIGWRQVRPTGVSTNQRPAQQNYIIKDDAAAAVRITHSRAGSSTERRLLI